MQLSTYNIFSKIKDSDNYFIVNLLYGSADILNAEEGELYARLQKGKAVPLSFIELLIDKGYWINKQAEASFYRDCYLNFIDERENDEIQLFFVANYSCNFACSYCYQNEYQSETLKKEDYPLKDVIDSFFQYISSEFAHRKKYITLFGGEPLLLSQKENVSYLIQRAKEAELELCIVTNGYTLVDYIDILKDSNIREIQVTLDGTEEIHNQRRFLQGSKNGTFDKIVEGIDACLENQISINLRFVADKENINNIVELATFAVHKGWTKNNLFKTQIGRNYELHHCQSAPEKLFSRISLYEKLYELIQQHPNILEFHKPGYSVAKFLRENGSLPEPLFDSCPACKTEWAFDFSGQIYPCTATVGLESEALGSFYPEVKKNEALIGEWEKRDVTSIEQCKSCTQQLACGGGCGSVAKNKTGNVCSADCRPIKELLEMGLALYH
jgi:uncharacterized protein